MLENNCEEERGLRVVMVKLTKEVPGLKLVIRGSILKIPLGRSLIFGLYETRRVILPFRITRSRKQAVVVMYR